MKKTLVITFMLTLMAGTAFAQHGPGGGGGGYSSGGGSGRGRFGAGVLLGVPIGDWGDLVDFSLGILLNLDYSLQPQLALTGRAGYIQHLVDGEGVHLSTVPFWFGLKYLFGGEGTTRPFIAGELGFNFNRAKIDGFGSDSDLDLGLNLGGGVEIGAFSLQAMLGFLDVGHSGDSTELMVSGSYYFLAF